MLHLDVYVSQGCHGCAQAHTIVAELQPRFPQIAMQLHDIAEGAPPPQVFAIPTYLLEGRIVALGNPYLSDLVARLQTAADRISSAGASR